MRVTARHKYHSMLSEHDTIASTRHLSETGPTKGELGAIVHVYPVGLACEVEFISPTGKTIAVWNSTSWLRFALSQGKVCAAARQGRLSSTMPMGQLTSSGSITSKAFQCH